jgi:hypothetical protein
MVPFENLAREVQDKTKTMVANGSWLTWYMHILNPKYLPFFALTN